MRHLLTCAALAVVSAAQAALPTSGLPTADHPLVIHVSLEAADKTKMGKVMVDEIDRQSKADANAQRQFELMGISGIRDLRDITLLMTPGDGAGSRLVGLLRGKFNKAKIEGFATEKKVALRTVAGLKAWSANGLDAALGVLGGPASADGQFFLIVADDTTLVVADEASLLGAAEALKANKPWKQADLAGSLAAVTGGWMTARVDVLAMEAAAAANADPAQPAEQPSGAKTFTFAAGENASDIQLRGDMSFVSSQKATEAVTQARGLLGFAQLGLMPAEEDSPEDAAKKADLLAIVQRLKLEQTGDRASLDILFPAAKAADLLRKQVAEGEFGR
jgi:hypothetical protein